MKIVIVGGVAAGASAAARARRLDERAEIVMLERGKHVSFANCGLPYHVGGSIKDRQALLLQTPESLKAALNLDVRVGHEARGIDRKNRRVTVCDLSTGAEYEESYDKLILAPGAAPIRPKLPGIEHPRILVLRNVDDMDRIKQAVDGGARSAVVIGGGYIGVEMAENLRERGLDVSLVEMVDQLMPPLDREMARDLEKHMRARGVKLHLGTAASAFRDVDGRVAVELRNTTVLEADLVIMSAGVRPESALAATAGLATGPRGGILVDGRMRTSDPDIYAAGDAVEFRDAVTGESAVIPLAGPANRQGRIAADNVCGRDSEYRATQGTAIVKVFDMTGGCTGASEKTLKRLDMPYRKVYLHPSGHAGYYPGTAPMHMKLLFAPDTGRILGAQVTGYDGVDKRLDVLAVAIRAGMTVYDLEHLELAYAPPYGSAKDPVNMAGFVAANMLRGDVEFWYAEDYPAATGAGTILDVRGREEYETWHVPASINIPLGKLRARIGEIPAGKPVFVYCKVGFRSYLAYRILRQNGYTVKTLAGGALTFCSFHDTSICGGEPEQPMESYEPEKKTAAAAPQAQASGWVQVLDCCGMQCPGPIARLKETIERMAAGDEVKVSATDPGFSADATAWCRRNGHEVLSVENHRLHVEVRIRKRGNAAPARPAEAPAKDKKTMVVFSGDLDKVLAAFIIANGAASMGSEVTMFFTFWGINALRKNAPQPRGKNIVDLMFGWMMPKGPGKLKLSKMNMLGLGTVMMKEVMKAKNVESLPSLMESARRAGVRMVVCTMSMDVMGITRGELVDGLDFGGVATFLEEADHSSATLFI